MLLLWNDGKVFNLASSGNISSIFLKCILNKRKLLNVLFYITYFVKLLLKIISAMLQMQKAHVFNISNI